MTASTAKTLLLGHTVRFIGNPFKKGVDAAVRTDSQGGILMSGGKIEAIGTGHYLRSAHPQAKVIDYCDYRQLGQTAYRLAEYLYVSRRDAL